MLIDKLRHLVWEQDVPHPTIPEYRELHEKIQKILRFIDEEMSGKVFLDESTYKTLKRDSLKLAALEAGGVDNWDFYSDALHYYYKDPFKEAEEG